MQFPRTHTHNLNVRLITCSFVIDYLTSGIFFSYLPDSNCLSYNYSQTVMCLAKTTVCIKKNKLKLLLCLTNTLIAKHILRIIFYFLNLKDSFEKYFFPSFSHINILKKKSLFFLHFSLLFSKTSLHLKFFFMLG